MYKVSPTPSIEAEGGIKPHVDSFFEKRGLPYRFADVVRLKDMRIGKRPISKQTAADELHISRQTIYDWYKRIDNAQG